MEASIGLMLFVGFASAACTASSGGKSGGGDPPVAAIATPWMPPLEGGVAILSASDSYDPDNAAPAPPHGIAAFHWELTSIPSGSVATIATGTDGTATFDYDVPGTFEGQLIVEDEDGQQSEPALFSLTATPLEAGSGAKFVILWNTDADLNLHVFDLNQEGGPFGTTDCSAENLAINWGVAGTANDPIFVGSNGYGPESCASADPGPAASFRVWVLHESGTAPTEVAYVISINETRFFDSIVIPSGDQYWDAIQIDWPTGVSYNSDSLNDRF